MVVFFVVLLVGVIIILGVMISFGVSNIVDNVILGGGSFNNMSIILIFLGDDMVMDVFGVSVSVQICYVSNLWVDIFFGDF